MMMMNVYEQLMTGWDRLRQGLLLAGAVDGVSSRFTSTRTHTHFMPGVSNDHDGTALFGIEEVLV